MANLEELFSVTQMRLANLLSNAAIAYDEITLEISRDNLLAACRLLKDDDQLAFNMLIDVCGVDYLHYGIDEWQTKSATSSGFERGVEQTLKNVPTTTTPRFAVVIHLLSLTHNHRIRIKVRLEEADLYLPSVTSVWPAANWFEREAFDLFGIVFSGHEDLRRLLTDYGFIGHPFRKDFPLIGKTEVRYDAESKRVVYEPVSITERILQPKVIRKDNRYQVGE